MGILGNELLPKALKSCPKSNKSPDLVTLSAIEKITVFIVSTVPTADLLFYVVFNQTRKYVYNFNSNQHYRSDVSAQYGTVCTLSVNEFLCLKGQS